jgi:hypothetical protein
VGRVSNGIEELLTGKCGCNDEMAQKLVYLHIRTTYCSKDKEVHKELFQTLAVQFYLMTDRMEFYDIPKLHRNTFIA